MVGHDVSHGVSLYTTYHEVSQITKITLCVVSKVASMPSMLTNMIKEEKGRLCSTYPILFHASSTKNRNPQEVSYNLYVKCDITCQIVESKSNHPDRESLEDEAWRTDE